jgi:hypothetical protein
MLLMDEPKPISPRLRLQELLAIPERERTDSQWDELNELEIMLASGNRERAAPGPAQNVSTPPGHPHPRNMGKPHGKNPTKKFHRKRPKSNTS